MCTGVFTATIGLPCAHVVRDRLKINSSLHPDDFHTQWRLDRRADLPPIDPALLLRDPVKLRARGKDNGTKKRRERIAVELARQVTAVLKETRAQPTWDYTKVARESAWNRTIEDIIQYLPKLASGPSFQRVTPNEVTENKGPEELFPEPQWVDELWDEDIRMAPETYRLYQEIGRTRDRVVHELLYWREERADLRRMQDIARQAVRERLQL